MSENVHRTADDDLAEALASADEAYRDVEDRIAEYGEETVEAVADAHDRATDLLDRYQETATGTGRENFQQFLEFKSKFASLAEEVDDDLPASDAFEAAEERVDKRRLNESDFEAARAELEPATEIAGLLGERQDARAAYREVRRDVERTVSDLRDEIAERERLLELGDAVRQDLTSNEAESHDADFDAPVEEIRDPIETYNAAVSEAFAEFKSDASAREVLDFVAATGDYSLVSFRDPPESLREYVESREVGTEPISELLTYARYSNSKLDHYVDDPAALKRAVATNETYLERLDAEPLELGWPPDTAASLRWRIDELVSVVARFAPEEVVARLREIRSLVHDEERFERLRTVAKAEAELSESEREKVASGEVEAELADLRARTERLEAALEEYPDR